ncbi:putative non-specific serine/threonine protein kinase [Medicago truncatula]|uniref:PWWP domain protein n=1 Tax=Medicago truncatula TaxID=3880 RepID=A0A072VLI5_MEDTR|nr:uncharacterized protein LOC25484045 [Medicago truncatula]KEH42283.1 PWWP domain protein [Medicago truncatula]RHN79835.1 putative non-specific serine/threonine protein kinase [Medicago truncatula]
MAMNSEQIDLNADTVLFDREKDVLGFKSLRSNVGVGVSFDETLISDVGGNNDGFVDMLSGTNVVGFHKDSGCGKEGFCDEKVNGFEDGGMFDVVDGGCDGKGGKFSCGLVKNDDEKSVIQCSDGGAESDKGLVFGLNDGVQIKQEGEDVEKVALSNELQGVKDDVTEGDHKVKKVALPNLSAAVEDEGVIKAADCFVTKDDPEDSSVSDVATYQLQDGIPYVEGMDVNKEEYFNVKDLLSKNCHGRETSCELKQPVFLSDAQVNVIQNQTTCINMSGAAISENIQYDCCGFDLVGLNSCKNAQEDSVPRESESSEANYRVSDLVWGKVRSHPWWPGQIYDPLVASEKAKKQRKENCYLIAYFGDQTFAWNDTSMIKPFHKHFSEMEKQSDMENFRHAVDCALEEASRRVEFVLSCPCMPGETYPELKTKVIANNAASFEPMELVNFVKSLAQSPLTEFDRLDFVSACARLSAFYRSKGYSQLPEFAMLDRLFENDMEILLVREHEQCDDQINEQHISWNTKQTGKKKKLLSDLMSEENVWTPNGECIPKKKAGGSSISRRGRKRKAAYDTSYDYFHHSQIADDISTSRRGRKPKAAYNTPNDCFNNSQIAANNSTSRRGRKLKTAYNTSNGCFNNSQIAANNSTSRRGRKRKVPYNTSDGCLNNCQTGNLAQLQNVSIGEMQSQICLAATDPAGESCSSDMIYFFAEFKKFTGCNDSVFLELGLSLEQEHGGETEVVTSIEAAATASMSTPTPMVLCNDSYWTDRIIQSISDEETLLKNQNEREELLPAAEISPNLGLMHQESNGNLGSEPSNYVENVNESSPTSLTLKFTNLDSVPSTADLNKIFGRFGPLVESKTELLERTNRARVVFKRRCDAETAFSSAGKYSIFGPSLQSYRLRILPRTPKKGTGKRGRKSKKEKSSVDAPTV